MSIKIRIFLLIFGLSFGLQAQTLSGDYQGYLYRKYYIGKYQKGKFVLIDSLKLDTKGKFTKILNPKIYTPNNLYVVASEGEYKEKKNIDNPSPDSSIRFVYMGKDISYKTSWKQETENLEFLKGGAPNNDIKKLNKQQQKAQTMLKRMEILVTLLDKSDPLYKELMEDYAKKATEYNTFCKNIAQQYPKGSYMNVYARMYQQVVPEKNSDYEAFDRYRAINMFQFTDLKNPVVANMPMLKNMYKNYVYQNQPLINGLVNSSVVQKMQDDAKMYLKKNTTPEVLQILNLQNFKPHLQVLRERFTNDLSYDDLYKDNKTWFYELDDIITAYKETSSPYHSLFGTDAITALERTKNPEAYAKLAKDVVSIASQFKWIKAKKQILDYLTEKENKKRLKKENDKKSNIFKLKKLQ